MEKPLINPRYSNSVIEAIEEIMRIYKSLPPRPTIDEITAAKTILRAIDTEERLKLEEIDNQKKPSDIPEELFLVLQEARKNMVLLQSHEQRKEALFLVDLDKRYEVFDGLIQRASKLVSVDTQMRKGHDFDDPVGEIERNLSLCDQREEKDVSKHGSFEKDDVFSDAEKLSLIKVASLIETSAKSGARVLDLQGKLMDQIEWLPTSLEKLSDVVSLNLSENRIATLPSTIGSLKCLVRLDIHSNQLISLPDSIGELSNLTHLDLHGNKLRTLPLSFGNLMSLVSLDLSSNQLSVLPETIGNLTSLKALDVETNELEELPYTIGSCSSLVELRVDFNRLKALPEAIGKLECLEKLTSHYNRIRSLPATIGSLSRLRELDVSFNELESLPETLCFATSLVKLNVGRNFADLRSLPQSIGNLVMLEELDISNNQIRVLPDSFRFLSKLRVFHADETPLEVPPRQIVKLGAQAVVEYMAALVESKNATIESSEKKGFWLCLVTLCWTSQKNHDKDMQPKQA